MKIVNMFLCRICCKTHRRRTITFIRRPTSSEMDVGVPEWFHVLEKYTSNSSRVSKVYISPQGNCFNSVDDLKKWRENLVFMGEKPYF